MNLRKLIPVCSPLLLVLLTEPVHAKEAFDVTALSLEELMNIEVTSVSKSSQPLSQAASAIYVLTAEDIRRSGVRSIPEALRMVPGLHVAQIDASNWAISSRGFNDRFSNKLLVLMDGRTLYTPLFSGVYWNVQDTVLEDIERIEVIRGSGGTLWGANAVNGVINIISKRASATQGTQVVAEAGTSGEILSLRHGGMFGKNGNYRLYAKASRLNAFKNSDDSKAHDEWDMQRAGFRVDLSPSHRDEVTIQGDVYSGDSDQTVGTTSLEPFPSSGFIKDTVENDGNNLLLRWTRQLDSDSEWSIQAYIDQTHRKDNNLEFDIDTYDIDFQHQFSFGGRHEVTWGLGYRHIEDDIKNSFTVSFTPDHKEQDIFSAFVQDKIQVNDSLAVTIGTKFENNDYSGDEWQPSARLLWQINEQHNMWAAVSRAIRSPSRAHNELRLNVAASPGFPYPTLVSIFGGKDFDAENLTSIEMGYRGQVSEKLTLDIATFYNRYNNLISKETNPFTLEPVPAPTHFLVSSTNDNKINADSYGIEISSSWQISPKWRLHSSYSWMSLDADADSSSTDTRSVAEFEDTTAHHRLQLRSQYQLAHNLEFDSSLYYTNRIKSQDIPAYVRLDMRLGWKLNKDINLDLIAQNLLDDRHTEFVAPDITNSEVPRAVGVRMALHW